jgi:hypothetical protein
MDLSRGLGDVYKRQASKSANSWVLSPISARATIPVEIKKASIASS